MESDGDLGRAVDDARDAIQRIRADLPADITEPVVQRIDAASQPIGYYAVEGEGITGVICGRAIYTGALDFAAAQKRADELNGAD